MEYAKELLNAEDTAVENLGINDRFEYSTDQYHDLVIEKIGPERVSVGQYYKQRMDLMHAPEIVFDTSGGDWTPIEYTNHDTVPQTYEHSSNGLDGLDQFIDTWQTNLESQYPLDSLDELREVSPGNQ